MKKILKRLLWPILLIVHTVSASFILCGILEYRLRDMRGYEWWQYAYHYWSDPAFQWKLAFSFVTPIVLMGLLAALFLIKPKKIYGDSRWAKAAEIAQAKLFAKKGLILGKHKGKFLISDEPAHTLLVAPTRSGKGVGVVIPNCLNWHGSLVCLDVKQENYKLTSGYRAAHGNNVFLWSPMAIDRRSACFNPLDMVSNDPYQRVSDLQIMATLLVSVSDKDPMWGQEAQSLFVGSALYVMQSEDYPSTLGAIYRFISGEQDLGEKFHDIIKDNPGLSSIIVQDLGNFANKAPKEASGVKSNLSASLRIFSNPVVDAATSKSDFSLYDLRRRKLSVYVGVLPNQLETLAPLLRLFFQQVISIMSSSEPAKDEPHTVLMLLDEFPSIGAMDSVVSAFTLLAGYNVRVLAIIQGLSWIDKNYGKDTREGLIANCAHQIFFATNDETTSKYVSDALGEKTSKQTSYMKNPFAITVAKGTKTISSTGRPLMMPQDVRRLDKAKSILINEGSYPILGEKIYYYKSSTFKKRLLGAADIPTLDIKIHERTVTASSEYSESDTGIDSVQYVSSDAAKVKTPFLSGEEADEYQSELNQLLNILNQEAAENEEFAKENQGAIDDLANLIPGLG